MELVSPYTKTILYTKVIVLPRQLNNDLYYHIKSNVKKEIEGRCNKYGYVTKVYEIKNYEEGQIQGIDFNARVVYKVTYSAEICNPIVGSVILCKLMSYNRNIIYLVNGPIQSILDTNYLNKNLFDFNKKNELVYKTTGEVLKHNETIVKIKVARTTFYTHDQTIIILGNIIDIANEDEIKGYYTKKETKIEEIEEKENEDTNYEIDEVYEYKNDNVIEI